MEFSLRSDVLENHELVILVDQHLWPLEGLLSNLTELAYLQHLVFIIGVEFVDQVCFKEPSNASGPHEKSCSEKQRSHGYGGLDS